MVGEMQVERNIWKDGTEWEILIDKLTTAITMMSKKNSNM